MSRVSIHETLDLAVPPERVWQTLLDPEQIARCLPGASLEGAQDERTYKGSLRVSLGPVTVAYRGTIVFEDVDHAERRVRVSGRGREATGSGTATLTMESQVTPGGAGSLVTVESDVHVTGKLVTYGRGMIERISQELFHDFALRLNELLAGEQAPAKGSEPSTAAVPGVVDRPPSAPPGGPSVTPPSAPLSAPRLLWRVLVRFLADLFGRSSGRPRG